MEAPMNRIRRPILPVFALAPAVALIVMATPAPAPAQLPGPDDFEYGDAPEGQLAYPANGIAGNFPTCLGGPSGFIRHAPNVPGLAANAWFGPTWDLEVDGNAGLCVPPPYERDECWAPLDGD